MFNFSDARSVETSKSTNITWFECKEIFLNEMNSQDLYDRNKLLAFTCDSKTIQHLSYTDAVEVAKHRNMENVSQAEAEHSDLLPGVYEGGLKVWECTRDLADYVTSLDIRWDKATVLDLGCGAGILGILALLNGSQVIFQDYNPEVLELLTIKNVIINVPDVTSKTARFFSGDWAAFQNHLPTTNFGKKFDVILTSETIYNPDNYEKLHSVIASLLSPSGVCYLAGKTTYFGVGGSLFGFQNFLNDQGLLLAEPCWCTTQGVRREIVKIVHQGKT